jgi:hypothetical protein
MSQLRVDMDLERLTRDAALAEASELKAKVSELAAAKAQLVSEKSEQAAEISRLEEKLKHGVRFKKKNYCLIFSPVSCCFA